MTDLERELLAALEKIHAGVANGYPWLLRSEIEAIAARAIAKAKTQGVAV